jgi:hypothetical protein
MNKGLYPAPVLLAALALAVGCRAKHLADHAVTSGPMPPNTVMLSSMMQKLSSRPGFTETFLQEVQQAGHTGAAVLTPDLIHHLRDEILGSDWQGLDRFPGWTMSEINPTVRVVSRLAAKHPVVTDAATAGGAPSGQSGSGEVRTAPAGQEEASIPLVTRTYLDLGSLSPEQAGQVSFDKPSQGAGFNTAEYVSSLGDGVTRGDGPNPQRAPFHADSARLAEVLNRLSLNGQPGVAPFTAEIAGHVVSRPEDLIGAIGATGHHVVVADSRYFANFGHLHYKPDGNPAAGNQDVMMPFWVNALIVVPHTHRPLLVPVSHAEYEWFITTPAGSAGPPMTAQVSFYFGIDGKAEFRTMDQLDQAWVENRHAHEYRNGDALEVTKLMSEIVRTYIHLHQAYPAMPFGGYYAFGVCQDVVAAGELKLTGTTTLFPNTADAKYFTDPADNEINTLIKAIPKDRDGKPPQMERIFGSLPVGSSDAELARVSIPGLGADLVAVHDAWTAGHLRRIQTGWRRWLRWLWLPLAVVLLLALVYIRRRRQAF